MTLNLYAPVEQEKADRERAELEGDIEITEERAEQLADEIVAQDTSIEDALESQAVLEDKQGNPIDINGKLIIEKVENIDEISDEDFNNPKRSVQLPTLPKNVSDAIGSEGKPVIIKKNIFEKNRENHKFTPVSSRTILKSALYNTDLIGQTQPLKKPFYWVAIKRDEKSPIVILEVNEGKDNTEIVGWYTLDERNLERIKRQADKNDGELIILSPKDKVESLSTPPADLSSAGKGTNKSEITNTSDEKVNTQEEKSAEDNNYSEGYKELQSLAQKIKEHWEKFDKVTDDKEEDEFDKALIPISQRVKQLLPKLSDEELSKLQEEENLESYVSEEINKREAERTLRVTFDEISKSQSIEQKDVKKGSVKMTDFTSIEDLRPLMNGVYHNEGDIVASDGHILIVKKGDYDKALEGKVTIDEKRAKRVIDTDKAEKIGNEYVIEGKYPNYHMVIPNEANCVRTDVDVTDMRKFLAGAVEQIRTQWKNGKENKKIRDSFDTYLHYHSVLIKMSDGRVVAYKVHNMSKLLDAMDELGMTSLYVDNRDAVMAKNDKGTVLAMPVYIGEYTDKSFLFAYDTTNGKSSEIEKQSTDKDADSKSLLDRFNAMQSKIRELKNNAKDLLGGLTKENYDKADEETKAKFDNIKKEIQGIAKSMTEDELIKLAMYNSRELKKAEDEYQKWLDEHDTDNLTKEEKAIGKGLGERLEKTANLDKEINIVLRDYLGSDKIVVAGNVIKYGGSNLVGRPLTEEEADDIILSSNKRAIPIPKIELTPENWKKEFGNGIVNTPIGDVKMGKNQYDKLIEKGRQSEFGMIKPTLTNPDFIIEINSEATDRNSERPTSYMFVKSFIDSDGKKKYFFKSVTVKKDGMEVSISSHIDRPTRLRKELQEGKLLWKRAEIASNPSDVGQGLYNQPEDSTSESAEEGRVQPQSNTSADKGTNNLENTKTTTDKIEDVGEKILGARKDMYREMAKSFEDVTEKSLVELPFVKAFKRPNLAKAVESGALREKDAMFYEAFFNTLINPQKPKLSQRMISLKARFPETETDVDRWAKQTNKTLEALGKFIGMDEAQRDAFIEEMTKEHFPNREQELAEIQERKTYNRAYYREMTDEEYDSMWGTDTTPNPIWVTSEVLNRLGYKVGDKVDLPFSTIKANSGGKGYMLTNKKGEYLLRFGSVDTIEEAIDDIVYLAKLKRGDDDIQHPIDRFDISPTKWDMEETGEYEVYNNRRNVGRFNKEEADKYVESHKHSYAIPIQKVSRRYDYKIKFGNALTGERTIVSDKFFDTEDEARAYLEENYDEINENVNSTLAKEAGRQKKEITADDLLDIKVVFGEGRKKIYVVVVDEKYSDNMGMPYEIKGGFESRNDAKDFLESIKDDIFKVYKDNKEEGKKFVYFDTGEDSRIGTDYRNGKDVTADDFMNAFGFRGVQFGNWTNQADRQMAVNQAYDAFMDLANLIGVSPKAISLNGELGMAFGARGVPNANAHYELGQVVINLTKKKGAGSLAHEWWHALDNYFSRQNGVTGGMVTTNPNLIERAELQQAYKSLMDMVLKSDYAKRSRARGDYWGRSEEITARLLAEWVDQELKNKGEVNTFLSRGDATKRWQKYSYKMYKKYKEILGEEPMSFEEYKETPESLRGCPYPYAKEVSEFSDAMRNIFTTIQERETDNGMIALFQKALSEPYTENTTEAQRLATETAMQMLNDNANVNVHKVAQEEVENGDNIEYSRVTDDNATAYDKKIMKEIADGKTTTIYRGMQLVEIDGKQYALPPMASKINGEWVQGLEVRPDGTLEPALLKADEHPELATEDGKFFLDKGNAKGLYAAYNPYWHVSSNMLNDQFAEAQSRPNLITVEGVIPTSEFTSGYRADKAKNSVGVVEDWKPGIIQGQLTGKREVILSRYFQGTRIVPNEEVARNIFEQINGKFDAMPTNVVPPGVREELEKLGVKFVNTNNNNVLLEGEHKGDHYSWWYGDNAEKNRAKNFRKYANKAGIKLSDWLKENGREGQLPDVVVQRADKNFERRQNQSVGVIENALGNNVRIVSDEEVQRMAESGDAELMAVNDKFNEDIERYLGGTMKGYEFFEFGMPGEILKASEIKNLPIVMSQNVLKTHIKKHNLSKEDIKDLPSAIQTPLMIYSWGKKNPGIVIVTHIDRGTERISVAIRTEIKGGRYEINDIRSIHGKDASRMLDDMNNGKSDFSKDNLKYVDKEKAFEWLSTMEAPLASSLHAQTLISATKIIEDFENPKISEEKNADTTEFLKKPDGTIYGYTIGKDIYLTKEGINPNSPIHEYSHVWCTAVQENNPELWDSVKSLIKDTPIYDEVMSDKAYTNILQLR